MKKPFVSIVDDDSGFAAYLRTFLSLRGYEARCYTRGDELLASMKQAEAPDVILLDVMMPGMDGWEVFGELLKDEETAGIPVVFLTARAELRDQARGLELGGVDYVTKPFNPLDLAPLVRELLVRIDRGERDELRGEKLAELRALIESE
jgi:DNA-binding response OmpR family regulator